jgi:hypothetical protein
MAHCLHPRGGKLLIHKRFAVDAREDTSFYILQVLVDVRAGLTPIDAAVCVRGLRAAPHGMVAAMGRQHARLYQTVRSRLSRPRHHRALQ